ncbi:MAG TPA: hypothetical protein VNU72_06995, partial [Puia sp.]|nr:hypothetical protein [Puia sp.]
MNRIWLFIIGFACTSIVLFGAHRAVAQDTHKDSTAAVVRLSPERLKALEGYYQSTQNKDMVVRMIVAEGGLKASLLWNNQAIRLVPETEWSFVSMSGGDGETVHVLFHRDSSGLVNVLDVSGNGSWKRVNDYKAPVKKEMEHTPEQLAPFEGTYQLKQDNSRLLQFTVRDNKLVLKQLWDGNEVIFVPESDGVFFSRVVPMFSLEFTKDKDGNITQALAFKRDVWVRVKDLAITPALLKSYEGKYRSKDDPDNEIRIIATDSNLVVRQLWDKKEIVVRAVTDVYFSNPDRSFPVVIGKDADGKVNQVTIMTG